MSARKAHMVVLGVGTAVALCGQPAPSDESELDLVEALDEVTCKRCWKLLKSAYPISTSVVENKRAAALIAALNTIWSRT